MKRQDDGQYIARKNFSNMDYRPIWGIRSTMNPALRVMTPQRIATEAFTDAAAAVVRLDEIYERNTHFLRDCFEAYVNGESLTTRVRTTYPFVRLTTSTHARLDSRCDDGAIYCPD